jgi:hypothetical protein
MELAQDYNQLQSLVLTVFFFLGGCRGTLAPKHFVNLTGESKNFKMLELRVPLNIFLEKKALGINNVEP